MIEANKILPRDSQGRFLAGMRYSTKTQFQKGQHWRSKKPYWDYDWLYNEYILLKKSASEIAKDQNCKEANILYFLRKHKIKTRTVSEVREHKHWGLKGYDNGMYGRTKNENPNWKGGITPERQSIYTSKEWKALNQSIREKDNYKCQRCLCEKTIGNPIHIHHIKSFQDAKMRMDKDNLISLCKQCHNWVHSKQNINKEYIIE